MPEKQTLGIIDLGSNSSRLTVFEHYPDNSYRPVFEMKRSLQLAHHLAQTQSISDNGIERAVACTKLFVRTGELHGVTQWIAVATAAIRQSNNKQAVIKRLLDETGLEFRVLSGEEEGYFGYLAVINTLPVEDALIFDIGGASSELMLIKDRQLTQVMSLPYGALSLTEKFGDMSKEQTGEKVRSFFRNQLRTVPWISDAATLPLVGLGGTARATAKLQVYRLEEKTVTSIHGYEVQPSFVTEQFSILAKLDTPKISKIKGISKRRSGIITAGIGAIAAIIDEIKPPRLLISRNGIREGLFFSYYLKHRTPPIFDSVLEESLSNFLKIYDVHRPVADTVTENALSLFDQLQPVHQLDNHSRTLLRVTAQIESCGTYVNTEKWTKHSAYLALSSNLYGLTYSELTEVADLLGGKGTPQLKKLGGLIRLAKLFGLQLGLAVDALYIKVGTNKVHISHPTTNLKEQVLVSADANIESEFQSVYGYALCLD